MSIGKFDYYAPQSLDEALELLKKHGPGARVMAGGTDLMVNMKKKIEAEKSMITSSTSNLVDKNFEMYQGKTMFYKVTVNVTLANDEVKDYIFILRKDALTLENRPIPSRLIITKIATVDEYEQELKQQEEEEMTEGRIATEEYLLVS